MRVLLAVVCAVAAAAGPTASAETWDSPRPRTVQSPSKTYEATVASRTLAVTRSGKRVYERHVVNSTAPVDVFVSDSGHVVTFDNWYGRGRDHAFVLYAPDGKLLADRRIEELFDTAYLAKHAPGAWIRDVPAMAKDSVVVKTLAGEMRFRLADGSQLLDGKPVRYPTDEERLVGYLTGARSALGSFEFGDSKYKTRACYVSPDAVSCAWTNKQRDWERKLLPTAFADTLRASLPLVPLANHEAAGDVSEQPYWSVRFTFRDGGYPFHYRILLRKRDATPAQAAAFAAIAKLFPQR